MGCPSGGKTRACSSETPCSRGKRSLHTTVDPETHDRLGEMATCESNDPLVLVGSLLNRYIYIERMSSSNLIKQRSQLWWRGRIRPRPPIAPEHNPRLQPSS